MDATIRRAGARAPIGTQGGLGFDYLFSVLALIGAGGVYWDGWAHSTFGDDQTVFNPYHLTFFGIDALLLALLGALWLFNLRAGRGWRDALPPGYLPALIALAGFWIFGVADQVGHYLFGFEEGVEALFSPTHIVLFIVQAIITTAPIVAARDRLRRGASPTLVTLLPAMIGAGLLMGALSFALLVFMPLGGRLYMLRVFRSSLGEPATLLGTAALLIQAALIAGVLVWVASRFRLPMGAHLAIYLTYGLLMTILFHQLLFVPLWLLAGLGTDLLARGLRPERSLARLVAYGAGGQLLLWSLFYSILEISAVGGGLRWDGYITSGTIVYAGIIGGLLAYLTGSAPTSPADPVP